MADSSGNKTYYGTIIHSLSPTILQILPSHYLTINNTQIISLASEPPSHQTTLITLPRGQFLIPGLIDTHNHAPQWPTRGLGQGMHILDWLSEITFPAEAKFSDAEHARRIYKDLINGMLRQGVTTGCYYSSLHGEGTKVLAEVALEKGQRALVGKCNMDRGSPDYYIDADAEESMQVTRDCIQHIRKLDPRGELIQPVLTPRFAISCTPQLLTSLGALALEDKSLPIQTHFNEAQQEIDATLSLFPDFNDEVELYSSFNLLNDRSILAHCTIMKDSETQKLHELGCGVAHCPTANMTVGGGFMAAPIRDFLERGMKVGLGTDSGGGYSSSILNAMRHALVASFAREAHYEDKPKGLTIEEVFWMATVGGARVVGLGDQVGNFEVRKQFDAVIVDMRSERNGVNAPLLESDSERTMFDKFVMTGDDRNIASVFVKGKKVHNS